ncbi:MAG: threonine--tRNA ligase, partial [Thermoplasmata archaeon]|nr:threonine--tRNA ligase [Thermoplasmata archaeon]
MSPEVTIVLPGGERRSVPAGTSIAELLRGWNPQGFPSYLAATWNGRPVDLASRVDRDGTVAPLTFQDRAGRDIVQHSAAHLVAKALLEKVPGALPTAGPPTDEGFYYDFD